MSPITIAMPGNEVFANELRGLLNAEPVELTFRHFPDGESYVRVGSEVAGCDVLVTCTLHRPDDKVLPLFFLAETLKELGAARVGLVAPYLAYMRQDRRFQTGEGVTSRYFASMVSSHFDWLVTVDPHLHRVASLDDLYSVPTRVVHAAPVVAAWIAENVEQPVLVGPDEESAQWVAEVAKLADAPYTVLTKIRHGDRDVEVSVPEVERWRQHTPVLVDDIISTARTMIETIGHLRRAQMRPAVCVGVHGVFADDAAERLVASGAATVATTDTIPHSSNRLSNPAGRPRDRSCARSARRPRRTPQRPGSSRRPSTARGCPRGRPPRAGRSRRPGGWGSCRRGHRGRWPCVAEVRGDLRSTRRSEDTAPGRAQASGYVRPQRRRHRH